ncbi:hypothetical protein [Neolewinella agarilytica]|nr:hypothetical protein [Neolewinella agarilytica]
MSVVTKIILVIIVLHLVVGFGWLIYMLAPRKKEAKKEEGAE